MRLTVKMLVFKTEYNSPEYLVIRCVLALSKASASLYY